MDDEAQRRHAEIYHDSLKKLREENKAKEQQLKDWENDKGLKPTRNDFEKMMGGPIRSEEELHQQAQKIANQRTKEQSILEKNNLIEPPSRAKLADFLKEENEKLQKFREEERRQREEERKREITRTRDDGGRSRDRP